MGARKDRTALVTGGGSGIGKAVVLALAREGARVAVADLEVGSSGEAVYSGTKGAVIAFTKALAREVARHGIRVNAVAPGPTDTPLLHRLRQGHEGLFEAMVRATPMRRLAQPEEVAEAVVFLASPRAGFITGQVLSVSGGLTMC
ncbi:SDR family NAD(P)-dependent oxidoreductase [Thermus islandicus]|uniref:SDR family NAD(P)-dependent oxidoreductase n=1 Tax=Thermus islandicus TaxID=540988 RepID=UPI0003B53A52|nr:SDR family oxidoreductase [Thermus islandicus]